MKKLFDVIGMFLIFAFGLLLGYFIADDSAIPALQIGKICFTDVQLSELRRSDHADGLRSGQQGCDDFSMNNCVSKFDLISKIGNCGYEASCPEAECDCTIDFKEGEKEGYKACVEQIKMYE